MTRLFLCALAAPARPPAARPSPLPGAARRTGVWRLSIVPILRILPVLLVFLGLSGASGLSGQDVTPDPVVEEEVRDPEDTFGDASVRALVHLAREARDRGAEGLLSYHARMWERLYLGVDSRAFRRERGIVREERAARIRWSADGDRHVRWEGARRDVPIAGLSSTRDDGVAQGLAEELSRRTPPPLAFDPGSDLIAFGGSDWALNPLADSAGLHYRFQSGDTLRITLPGVETPLTLAEVRVEPRRTEFRLLAASMWFDVATGALVRGVYRPARPFDLSLDVQGDGADEVPRILGPIRAEIRVISVDHGLFDLRWWIPQRFLFEGEATVGRLARFPLVAEWTVSDVEVNLSPPAAFLEEELPEGWTRTEVMTARGSEGDSATLVRIVPPASELAERLESSAAVEEAERVRFSEVELRALEATLGGLLPASGLLRPEVLLPPGDGLARFNRIEGLVVGAGVRTRLPGGREVTALLRLGTEALAPTAEVRLVGGTPARRWSAELYRRLQGSSEWHEPTGVSASLSNVLSGEGPTPWYRAWGGAVGVEGRRGSTLGSIHLFAESQTSAEVGTRTHLRRWFDASRGVPGNIAADPGVWGGLRGLIRWQQGEDPGRPRVFSTLRGETAMGESGYGRGSMTVGLLLPVVPGWDAALEAGAGGHLGSLPAQRLFFPGGASGFRGARVGEFLGDAYWMTRGEVARGFAGARAVVFVDALGVRDASGGQWASEPVVAGGAGVSFLDGLVRLDLARQLQPSGDWRVFAYFDALF